MLLEVKLIPYVYGDLKKIEIRNLRCHIRNKSAKKITVPSVTLFTKCSSHFGVVCSRKKSPAWERGLHMPDLVDIRGRSVGNWGPCLRIPPHPPRHLPLPNSGLRPG